MAKKNSTSKRIKVGESKKEVKVYSPTLKYKFITWSRCRNWNSWVEKLCHVHQSTWKNAGIYEAILSSTYKIKRQNDLIFELASRWRRQTNTFVFPWGEATLTLEDIHILGGFSASGLSISSVKTDHELVTIKERLELAIKQLHKTKTKAATLNKWIEKFRDCGNHLEHEAFLSLWLTMCVFPSGPTNNINRDVFPLAIKLSRGVEIALGPPVLSKVYQDLTKLASRSMDDVDQVNLYAPFQLVQIWGWERFPLLKQTPNGVHSAENQPRLSRWSEVDVTNGVDLKYALDSGENAFKWRPYDTDGPRDVDSLALYTRATELVGIDSWVEKYLPERVPMQFGRGEDILTDTVSSIVNLENAVDSGPPGFPRRHVEMLSISDSGHSIDDEDHLTIRQLMRRLVSRARPNMAHPSTVPVDVAVQAQHTSVNVVGTERSGVQRCEVACSSIPGNVHEGRIGPDELDALEARINILKERVASAKAFLKQGF